MRTCLLEFDNKIKKIESYLEYLEIEKELVLEECGHGEVACTLYKNQEKLKNIDKKIIDYNATIISLYGAYESFVEAVIKQYLVSLSEIVTVYEKLPEKLREFHFNNSIQLIQELDQRRYNDLNKNDIVNNLHKCINNEESYIINYDALLMHNSNMWPDTINELFKCVGISDFFTRLKNLDFFINFYQSKYDVDDKDTVISILNKRSIDEILRTIKELIEERNRVAHSWVENIDIDLVKNDYLHFIKVICKSIYLILEKELSIYEKDFSSVEITIDEIIRNRYLIFKSDTEILKLGDKIIIEKNNHEIDFGFITSIQDNGQNIEQSEYGQEVGVEVDYSGKLKNNYSFYLLKE